MSVIGQAITLGGGSSGGSELIIVGGIASPAKATHNTIWIYTNVEITSHVLSATEPGNPVEGMVLVTIGDSGNIAITSPVGGDWITVYPLSAKQYIGGAWVDKTAKSYYNGAWVGWWNGELYKLGNEFASVTGGWGVYNPNAPGYSMAKVTKADSDITISASGYRNLARCETENVMDLTKYNTVCINLTAFSGFYEARIGIVTSHTTTSYVAQKLITAVGLVELPLDGISSGIVAVEGFTENSGQSGTLTFNEVYLK